MKGKFSNSPSEKSMATPSTTTTLCTDDDSERRDSNCYFPDCRKDANCSCEICLRSLNATLDLMPLSVQKSSLTKLSHASNLKSTVESTPASFDPRLVTTPASISLPKKKLVKKSKAMDNNEVLNKERRPMIRVVMKVGLMIGLVLCFELAFRFVVKEILNPKFTEEIVRFAGERSHSGQDLGLKLRIFEEELKGFALSSCVGSNTNWKINQDGTMLNSKCVLYKSAIEEVSIWGWPLQTSGLFRTGFSSSSITVLSGRVTEWSEGNFGYSIHEANTSWAKTKWSTSVLQLDPNTWVLEYSKSSVMESSSFLSLTVDLLTHMMFQTAKNINREIFWMFSDSRKLYSEAVSKPSTMTPT
ncbi:unnamed protein product [Cochlearia groenlandica]